MPELLTQLGLGAAAAKPVAYALSCARLRCLPRHGLSRPRCIVELMPISAELRRLILVARRDAGDRGRGRRRRACGRCSRAASHSPSPASRRSRKYCASRGRCDPMPVYRYKAVNGRRRAIVEGTMDAATQLAAVRSSTAPGMVPIRADEAGRATIWPLLMRSLFRRHRRPSANCLPCSRASSPCCSMPGCRSTAPRRRRSSSVRSKAAGRIDGG